MIAATSIASGHLFGADLCFLIALILAALAAVLAVVPRRAPDSYVYAPILGWVAVALLALGFLLL